MKIFGWCTKTTSWIRENSKSEKFMYGFGGNYHLSSIPSTVMPAYDILPDLTPPKPGCCNWILKAQFQVPIKLHIKRERLPNYIL